MGPLELFDVGGLRGDEGEEVDDLRAVGVGDGDCLVGGEGDGDAGAGGDEVFRAWWVGVGHCGRVGGLGVGRGVWWEVSLDDARSCT